MSLRSLASPKSTESSDKDQDNVMKYPAAIFDLDGTLLDSLVDIANSANDVLTKLGHSPHPLSAYSTLVGDGVRVLFERALGLDSQQQSELIEECMRNFNEIYAVRCVEQSRLYPGIDHLVQELKSAGVKLAVLSNKPDRFTKRLVNHFFAAETFEVVLGQRDAVPRKPDPAAVYEIAQLFQIGADCIAYIGDTNTDMLTAQNAGCFAIGVTWGFRSREELVRCGADALADDAQGLLKLLISD